MKLLKLLLGAAAGLSTGYAVVRTVEALHVLRAPRRAAAADARAYGRLRRRLAVASTLRSLGGTLGAAFGPLAPALVRAARPLPAWVRPGAVAAMATLGSSALELGATFVDEYDVERRFALTEQTPSAWLADALKATALASGLSAGLAILAAAAMRRFPRTWPYVASLGLFPLLVAANVVVPLYVLPLFNRFEPLRGPLEARLRALAARYGVGDAEILRMDMSRQTNKANAFVTGIGRMHRIVLGDTLVEAFPEDEIAFVVAHELGHYVSKDVWRSIVAAELAAVAVLVTAGSLARTDAHDDAKALELLRAYAVLTTGLQVLRPALLAFSRSREWAADTFAIDATADPQAGAAAFARLRDQNLAEDEVPRWYEWFFSSHPSLGRRIARLRT